MKNKIENSYPESYQVEKLDSEEETIVRWAYEHGHTEIVRALINAGALVEAELLYNNPVNPRKNERQD